MNQLTLFNDLNEDNQDSILPIVDDENDTKICRICKIEKPLEDFALDRGAPYSKCKECSKKYQEQLRTVHKIAPPKPERCQCCNVIPKKWVCDHYPDSTIFRGWVCWECNNAAGSVGDSYEGAVKLLNYLYQRRNK
jgi:hypothetical protein